MTTDERRRSGGEAGFALILALLTLTLLTFLGLGLAAMTSTELQIAANYRWSQQAMYNAEAGLELARRYLAQQEWSELLPEPRPWPAPPAAPTITMAVGQTMPPFPLARDNPPGFGSRNWENRECDTASGYQGVGFGVVLDHTTFVEPFQHVSQYLGQRINGEFTVWVRRPIQRNNDGTVQDVQANNQLIITAEGTAPFIETNAQTAAGQAALIRRRAVRLIQVIYTKLDSGDCENSFVGQTGLGALGSNYDACQAVEKVRGGREVRTAQ